MKKVILIQRTLKFYRIPFLNSLKDKLSESGIELIFVYGNDDIISFNDATLNWGIQVRNYSINIFEKKLYYQPIFKYLKNSNLIIVEQATKYLNNYVLWILSLLKIKKLAFWGHGINFQSNNPYSFSELVKRIMTKKVDWFFAYTPLSKKIVQKIGMSSNRITTVYNTIDNKRLIDEKMKLNYEDISKIKMMHNIKSNHVCLFIGGIYREKKIFFLLESLSLIKESIPDFEFIFIGDGPERKIVENFSDKVDWIHYVGAKFDEEKVPYFIISKLLLIPGLVGLSILDSFIFETPLITTDCKMHSPEIDYLENRVNGLMTSVDSEDYAKTVINLLNNEDERKMLVEGCKTSARLYTMEKMVNNFFDGIITSLKN